LFLSLWFEQVVHTLLYIGCIFFLQEGFAPFITVRTNCAFNYVLLNCWFVCGHTISIRAQIYNIFLNCANAQLFFCTKIEKKEKKREKVRKIRKNRAINEKNCD